MSYTPPSGDSLAFIFSESYTAPTGDAIQFNFSGDIEVVVPEATMVLAGQLGGVSGDLNVIIPGATVALFGEAGGIDQSVPVLEASVNLAGSIRQALVGRFVPIPEAALSLEGDSVCTIGIPISEAQLALAGLAGPTDFAVPTGEGFFCLSGDMAGEALFSTAAALIRYYLTITGAADGLDDIEIPMSSFQARRRSGEPTYLSVVIPGLGHAAAIVARSNGTIRVDQGYVQGGRILQREAIIEAEIEDVATYQGAKNSSIVLTGYRQTTYTPKTVALTSPTYRSVVRGVTRFRLARPYIFLNPGDTAVIDGESIDIAVMSYVISPAQQSIEISDG